MTILVSKILAGLAAVTVLLAGLLAMSVQDLSLGSAPSGLPAAQSIATTTVVGLGTGDDILSAKAQCSSRLISTNDGTGVAIMLLFGNGRTGDLQNTDVSAVVGHLQAASTSVMYDAGLYCCGAIGAWASASTTLTVTEFN